MTVPKFQAFPSSRLPRELRGAALTLARKAHSLPRRPAAIAPAPIPSAPWRTKALTVLPDYRLAVTFMDGRSGVVDCASVLNSPNPGIYAPLADPHFFGQVGIELGVPTWPNGADLDPAWLYDQLTVKKLWSVSI